MNYPKELFHQDGRYRVTFSPEEHEQLKAQGWSDDREAGKTYYVHTAVRRYVPSINEVLAAGYSPEAAARVVARETALANGENPYPDAQPQAAAEPAPSAEEKPAAVVDEKPEPAKPSKKK